MGKRTIHFCDACGEQINPDALFLVQEPSEFSRARGKVFAQTDWSFHLRCWIDLTPARESTVLPTGPRENA